MSLGKAWKSTGRKLPAHAQHPLLQISQIAETEHIPEQMPEIVLLGILQTCHALCSCLPLLLDIVLDTKIRHDTALTQRSRQHHSLQSPASAESHINLP